MKDLKDYLHLYLGCQFLDTKAKDILPYELNIERLEIVNRTNYWKDIKLILRPLSDMTEEEQDYALKLGNSYLDSWIGGANRTAFLLSKHFDLFGFIEAGLAIDKTTLKQSTTI